MGSSLDALPILPKLLCVIKGHGELAGICCVRRQPESPEKQKRHSYTICVCCDLCASSEYAFVAVIFETIIIITHNSIFVNNLTIYKYTYILTKKGGKASDFLANLPQTPSSVPTQNAFLNASITFCSMVPSMSARTS